MAQFSEQDQILLNSYLDGRLGSSERGQFEARLAGDSALRAELETLKMTVELLSKAERVPVPRHFTLNPAAFAAPVRRSFLERLGLGPIPGWAIATASMVMIAVFAGVVLTRTLSGGGAPAGVASAPMMMAEATEAPMEAMSAAEATEAPTEEGTEFSMYAATEEVAMDATGAKMVPTAPGTQAPAGAATGGSTGGADGAGGGIPPSVPSEPNPELLAATTAADVANQDTQSQAAASGPEAGEAGDTARNAGTEVTTTPTATKIEGEEVNPWDGISGSSLAILLGGTGLLVAVVLGITFLRRRY